MISRLVGLLRKKDEDDCVHVRELSSEYIDEELDEPTVRRISSHLEGCGPCQAFFSTFKATVDLLRSSRRRGGAPEGFRKRVLDSIRQDSAN